MDVSATGTSGCQAADWLRENCRIDVGMSGHRRTLATLSFADSNDTAARLIDAMRSWRSAADNFERPRPITLPAPNEIQLESVMVPRDAFFASVEQVPADEAPGRIAAEQITPYPPGIPAVVPGELLDETIVEYLRTGMAAGMQLPDPADKSLSTFRVVAQ